VSLQKYPRPRGAKNWYIRPKSHTTGGRAGGASQSSDGRLDIKLSIPGAPGSGTNPEQLFAAGWSACFEGARAVVARRRKIRLRADTAIDAEVDLNLDLPDGTYFLRARLNVSLPGVDRESAQAIVNEADQICPWQRAATSTWRSILFERVEAGGTSSKSTCNLTTGWSCAPVAAL
jgi:osmotically inducible protein OsmC